MLCGIMKR